MLCLSVSTLRAQNAELLQEAKGNLDAVIANFEFRTKQISKAEAKAIEEVELFDNRALELSRKQRTLQREVDLSTVNKKSLETLLEARYSEFEFLNGTLKTYARGLPSRMQASEVQLYRDDITAIETAADSKSVLSEELSERLAIIDLGLQRLESVAGGHFFEGRADDGSDNVMLGKFAHMGPLAFFADSRSDKAGVVRFVEGDTGIPNIAVLDAERGSIIQRTIQSGSGFLPLDPTQGKALKMEQTKETLGEHLAKGGSVGYCILALGAVSLLITMFKMIEIKSFKIPSLRSVNSIIEDLLNNDKAAAEEKSKALSGAAGDMVQVGVRHFHSKRRVLEELLFEKIVSMRPKLERFLPFVAVTAAAAPLMGLLGTVMGMIKTFKLITVFGTGDAKNLATGISEALVTTELGLVVAIPTLILHGFLKRMAKARIGDVESIALSMLNGTAEIDDDSIHPSDPHRNRNSKSASKPAEAAA